MNSQRIQKNDYENDQKIKQDMNKCLNDFQENANKQLTEIRNTMQAMKEEFNKVKEILKK
jgi:hypothetical protein